MSAPGSLKQLLRKLFFLVAPTVVVCLVALEFGLRAVGRSPTNTASGFFRLYGNTYAVKKNYTKVIKTPSFTATIHSNSFGFRDRAPGPRKLGPAPYVAFLGDSITFGNGVDYDDSFVGVFARLVRSKGVDVINLAVGGHGLADQEALLDEFLASVQPKPTWIAIVFTRELMAQFDRRQTDLLLIDGDLFSKRNWFIPYLRVALKNRSAAYVFFRDGIRRLQGARTNPDAAAAMLKEFDKEGEWANPELTGRLDKRLTHLHNKIRQHGAIPLFIYMPVSTDLRAHEILKVAHRKPEEYDFMRFHRLLADHCAKTDTPFIDLLSVLQEYRARVGRVSFLQDPHYDVAANRVIGRALNAKIREYLKASEAR